MAAPFHGCLWVREVTSVMFLSLTRRRTIRPTFERSSVLVVFLEKGGFAALAEGCSARVGRAIPCSMHHAGFSGRPIVRGREARPHSYRYGRLFQLRHGWTKSG